MVRNVQFAQEYRKLNREQKEAVDAIEGPVMVIAGPGTGKTQILSLRILNILKKTDTLPDSILALTFTEAGVMAMRKRLVSIIGSEAYRISIYTFHGFANDLIARFPDEYPRIVGSRNINDIDKITLLRDIIERTKLNRLKPFGDPFYYLHPIRSSISELKRENISPDEALQRVKEEESAYQAISDLFYTEGVHKGKVKGMYKDLERTIEKNRELAVVYKQYEEILRTNKLYDYDDMITETIKALEADENFLLSLEEQYQYILADEHQDANNAQNRILELLSSFHESPNLFLVGDEKQAIYRFQGASLENFLYFTRRYPNAKVIRLTENYRSQQAILNTAHSLITNTLSMNKKEKALSSNKKGKEVPVEVAIFSRSEFEYTAIAKALRELIDEGVNPREIAVLYRNNNDAEALLPALEREHVSYNIESDQNVLTDIDIEKFIKILYAVTFFGNEERLVPLLYIDFLGIKPLDAYRVIRFANRERIGILDVLKSTVLLKKSGVEEVKKIHERFKQLSLWSLLAKNRSLLETLERIADESGFWGHIIAHERAQEKLDKYAGFVRDVEQLVETHREYRLADLMQYFELLREHNILVKRSRRYTRVPSVRLMTAHRAKGLEFDYVFLSGVVEGHWGNKRVVNHFSIIKKDDGEKYDKLADERRLFYVALTRARFNVFISYATEGRDGREQLPSPFLEEIDKKLLSFVDKHEFEREQNSQAMLAPRSPVHLPVTESTYLRELFLEQGLSVTALNNYLKNPWEYFFGNLLRVPKAPTRSMLFGTAMHNALNDFFTHMKDGEAVNKTYLLSRFKERLGRLPLSEREYNEHLTKGKNALSGYFDTYKKDLTSALESEYSVIVQFPLGNGESIPLRGVLDKIEEISGNEVNVVDYKTGRIRSRNDILGYTKNSNKDYWRQLVFYKLLLSLQQEDGAHRGRYTMTSGAIDFLEPDKVGRYHREVFTITNKDVEELKELIKKSAEEILSLSFWDTPCDPKQSNFCDLQTLLMAKQE